MRKIFGLGILFWVLALSAGYSDQQSQLTCSTSLDVAQQGNHHIGRSADHGTTYNYEENLLNSEEEEETPRPAGHLFSAEHATGKTLETFLISRVSPSSTENMILFEADSSPPPFSI